MYKIIRYYRSGKRKTILRGVTLAIAQLHCKSEYTHRKDKQGNIIWFDGYIEK